MSFKKKWSDYRFREDVTNEHPYHPNSEKFHKTCKICVNKKLLKESEVIPCPDCELYTLHQRLFKDVRCYDTEFYCTDCGEYWRRVRE